MGIPNNPSKLTENSTKMTGKGDDLRFDQWVDYLPHNDNQNRTEFTKRVSLDVTETVLTESHEDDSNENMEMEDWPESQSLEDYAMVPNALLVENDPVLQHELLLSDPTILHQHGLVTEQFATSLQEVLEHRRQVLMASMEASQRTRRCLEPHIRQRASLASVLSDIEGSSKSLREHVLHHASSPPAAANNTATPMDGMGMDVDDDETTELLASALNLASDEDEAVLNTTTSSAAP